MRHYWRARVSFVLISLVVGLFLSQLKASPPKNVAPFPAEFSDSNFFLSALRVASTTPLSNCVDGLIVPHHLLAKDKIAAAFTSVSSTQYNRIIVLSPDHFTLGHTKISVAGRNFVTATGKLETDHVAVQKIRSVPGVATADWFYREHGIGGILPFIAATEPQTKIVAISLRSDSRPADLNPLIEKLRELAQDTKTLIVGSIDFSHYLSKTVADQKDSQTKQILASNNSANVFSLSQPDNIDSRPVLYVVWSLEKSLGNTLTIVDHGNSQEYTNDAVKSTTSYFVITFKKSALDCMHYVRH